MAESNLSQDRVEYGADGIVIVKCLTDIPGGRTLAVDTLPETHKVIFSGHVIIRSKDGEYKPLGVTADKYNALAEGETPVGVLKCAVLRNDPRASIVTSGQVNAACSPYPVTDDIKKGLPRIEFLFADKHPKATNI